MSNPRQNLMWMGIYLAIVMGICILLYAPLKAAFMANWGFNLLILGALCAGIGINIFQVLRLEPELEWMKVYRTGDIGVSVTAPRLLSPLAKHLDGLHRSRFSLSALSLRTVLEGIRGRLDETREVSRYMIGLLIFLGLLGTFWGLLGTIGAVSKVIEGLEVGRGDYSQVFDTLKAGLQGPISGMGTAFSSSLFGLGGSLVLGFLDIQAGHAQNRFFNELEEWLSGVTQLIDTTDEAGGPADEIDSNAETAAAPSGTFDNRFEGLIHNLRQNNRLLERLLRRPKHLESLKSDSDDPR
jgi:hypothetical protein